MITNTNDKAIINLKLIILKLTKDNKNLENEISELKEKKDNLESHVKEIKKIIPKLKCKYPPYILSEILGISSNRIVKISEKLKLFNDEDSCLRIARVHKRPTKKFETIVLFSEYGIIQIIEALIMAIKDKNYNNKIAKLSENDIKEIQPLFLSYDEVTPKEIMALNESSLKKIWDNEIEDEAWKHL